MDKYKFTDEDIEMAKNVDIMSYLSSKGYTFKKNGTNRYLLEPHSSLAIFTSTNSWYSFKENKGGNLINFLQYYENKTFQEAMIELVGEPEHRTQAEIKKYTPIIEEKGELILPNANNNNNRAFAYLTKTRGIDSDIVNEMINQGNIYENDKGGVVFLGKDKENNVKFACVRGTNDVNKFRQDVKNSEKEYGFKTVGKSNRLFVFEAPIDLLSHATISKMQGEDWQKDNRVSLGGTSDKALNKFLEENENIEEIVLFLDNDEAGIENAKKIAEKYKDNYNIKIFNTTKGKDLNEMLLNFKNEKEINNNTNIKDFIEEIKLPYNKVENIEQSSQEPNKEENISTDKNISKRTRKINSLKNKYEETLNSLNSKEDFKGLLDTAIKFNKYPFDNIVLIHNQNPNAEFLATYDVWNNNVGRYINKGAKGIGVLELDKPNPTYRYLFEIKDTNGSELSYKKVLNYKWEVKEEDKNNLIKNINKNLGTNYESLSDYLYSRAVEEIAKKDGYFENLEIDEETKNKAYNVAIESLFYMLLKRCNYEIDLPNDLDFDSIKNIELFSKIGSLATDISRDILKDVFIQVKKLEKERERKGELKNGREINESYEKSNSRRQDDSRENGNRGNGIFRGRDDRNTISNIGDGGGRDRTEPNTIWNDVERVPSGEQKTHNNNFSDDRRTEPKDERSTGDSRLLRGEDDKRIIGETTNATIRQDARESITPSSYTTNSERDDNQGYNRESSILNATEEIKEPKENIGSFSIEENPIEDTKIVSKEDKISYIKANIGKEITLNKGKFIIEDVNDLLNEVKLGKNNLLYPVFKSEKVDLIYEILKNQELEISKQEEKVTILEKEIGNIISYQGKLYQLEEID